MINKKNKKVFDTIETLIGNGTTFKGDILVTKSLRVDGVLVGNIKEALGIHSPSTILRDEVGKFMAKGIAIGFSDEMKDVTKQMQDTIPTKFDVKASMSEKIEKNNNISLLKSLSEDIIGRPQAIASIIALQQPSYLVGRTKTSHAL